jgi:hypothetical protein
MLLHEHGAQLLRATRSFQACVFWLGPLLVRHLHHRRRSLFRTSPLIAEKSLADRRCAEGIPQCIRKGRATGLAIAKVELA